jgi:hypothetical protein
MIMENKDNYTPQEVAQMINAYSNLGSNLEVVVAHRIEHPEHDKKFAEDQRTRIMEEYEQQIPRNVLESLGITDLDLFVPRVH